jgi:hypothetical protein
VNGFNLGFISSPLRYSQFLFEATIETTGFQIGAI